MSERDKRAKGIFLAALEKAVGSERDAYLDKACGQDAPLRERVTELLRVHAQAGDFLESPVTGVLGLLPVGAGGLTEKAGDKIGPYKLLQQIGEGGCGVVYMAEQEGHIRRRVALKVIKLGMDTKQVIRRFEAERQALALMDHPNIAKVLDAGATETGRPYFVMELVRGIKITEYCDENNLSTEERLGLFVQICHAIQHAHQKGIIHRDIKPSNILVMLLDGQPVPKIIDFGIAKATGGQVLTDKTLFTAFEQFIGTPTYMSPEQAERSGLDVDTRSDIYALGVLLYELLTGKTPFDQKQLVAAGLDEMRRIIRETEPARPSTRLNTLAEAEQTTVAKRRHAQPPQLFHLVRGDLDWIVMKALEKDRRRRYETADGLAHDVLRHLNNEPITARPPDRVYRMQKLVLRNKLAFAAAGAVAAALVVGLGISTWFFFKERAAYQRTIAAEKVQTQLRQQAQAEAKKSEEVARFLKDMLGAVGPSVALGRDTTMLREILDNTARHVSEDLKQQPEVQAELQTTIGNVYWALGQYTNSEAMHRAALDIRRSLWGASHTNVASSFDGVGRALQWMGRFEEAEPLLKEALRIRTNLLGLEHPEVATSWWMLGSQRSMQDRLVQAEELFRRSLDMRRKFLGPEHPDVAAVQSDLARVLYGRNRLTEAENATREALNIRAKLSGCASTFDDEGTAVRLGVALRFQRRFDEAETVLRETLEQRRKVLGADHPLLCGTSLQLALVLWNKGQLQEAETRAREALALSQGRGRHEMNAVCLNVLGLVFRKQHKEREAEDAFGQALVVWEKLPVATRDEVIARESLAACLRDQGKWQAIEGLYREGIATQRKVPTPAARQRETSMLLGLARFLRDQRRPAEAEAAFRESLVAGRNSGSVDEFAGALFHYGDWLLAQGRRSEAESTFREGLVLCTERIPNVVDWYMCLARGLARSLGSQGKTVEAEEVLREGVEYGRKHGVSVGLALAFCFSADFYREQGRPAEAEPLYREGLEICRQFSMKGADVYLGLAGGLGIVQEAQGKLEEAEPLFRENLEVARKSGPTHDLATALARFADFLRKRDKLTEAKHLYREGLEICHKVCPEEHETRQWLASGLGVVLRTQGNLAEAERAFRESVPSAAKTWPSESTRWEWQLDALVRLLVEQGKSGEVDGVYDQLSQFTRIAKRPQDVKWFDQACAFGRQAKWENAIDCLTNAIRLDPTNQFYKLTLASALAFTGNLDRYNKIRREALEQLADCTIPNTCAMIAKTCLLLPSEGKDLLISSNWARIASSSGNLPDELQPWADSTMGHAEYRMGHFAEAERWAQRLTAREDPIPERNVQTHCILAMAQHQLSRTAEARTTLAKAAEITRTKLLQPDSSGCWWDYLLAHMLLREAQGLIGSETPP